MAKLIFTLIAIAVAVFFINQHDSKPTPTAQPMLHGLPWQVELSNGNTRVFGLAPGITTLDQAIHIVKAEGELAILAKAQESGALELYFSHFSSGPLQGKLILVFDLSEQQLASLKANAIQQKYLDNGTRKYTLSQQQSQSIASTPIRSITFTPAARLEQAMVEQRFGQTDLQISTRENVTHFLYPHLGLDILIDKKGKDLLQYVAPDKFADLQKSIEARANQNHR